MNFDFNNYGFGREWGLIDYESELEKELKENLGLQPQRAGMLDGAPPPESSLEQYLPTSFDTQGTADAIKAIDAMMGAGGAAPTGINPDAPAQSQPPVVTPTPTAVDPNRYERMRGVTDTDRLGAVAMGMTAIGSPDFAKVYGGLQAGLVQKQKTADEYNMLLDMGTKPETKLSGNTMITTAAKFIRNSDGTYSVNPNAGEVLNTEYFGRRSGSTGQAYNTFLAMKENGDISKDMTWDEFQASPAFDPFRTDYMRKVNNTYSYLQSMGIDDRNLASQMAAGALDVQDLEGGGVAVYDSAGNLVKEITSAEEAQGFKQAYENASSFGSKSGEAAVTDLQGFETRFRELGNGADAIISGIENARNVLDLYERDEEAGNVSDFNFVQGVMARFLGIGDKEMGELMGMETEALLEALQTTTLVPVSDADIRALKSMFASVTDNPELAKGKLKSFLRSKERQLRFDRDQFRRELDRLGDNRNILNPDREIESFKNTYRYLYDFETQEEFLKRTGGK